MKKVIYLYILNPIFLAGVIILVISLIFYVASFMVENSRKISTISRAAENKMQIIPPQHYSNTDEIQLVPRRINNYLFAVELVREYRQLFPELTDQNLQKLIALHTVEWAALRDLYTVNKLNLSGLQNMPEVTAAQIEREIPILVADYEPRVMQLEGFFLKARFAGIYRTEFKELGKTSGELRQVAQEKIQSYIDQARKLSDPTNILPIFNTDETLLLMNNGELSQTFTNYQLDPPLFDDPSFFTTIESAPLNEFSPIVTLKTRNPMQSDLEEYAYLSFFVTKRSGLYLPLTQIINEYLKVATIR